MHIMGDAVSSQILQMMHTEPCKEAEQKAEFVLRKMLLLQITSLKPLVDGFASVLCGGSSCGN